MPSAPLNAAPVGITGDVRYADGSPGTECLVYIQVEQAFQGRTLRSLYINTMTDGGSYAADIRNIRLADDIDSPLSFEPSSKNATIRVRARCDAEREGVISRTTAEADQLRVAGAVSEYQNMDVVLAGPAVR
jgi:hypothetical protein